MIWDQKSPAAVRWLPHRERRCVEARPCSILTQYTFLDSDKFAFCDASIASWTPMEAALCSVTPARHKTAER